MDCQCSSETGRPGVVPIDQQHRRAISHTAQLRAVGRIGHDQLRLAALRTGDAILDRLGSERSEQRLIHRVHAPGSQYHREKLRNARHQTGDDIVRFDASLAQQIGEADGAVLERSKRDPLALPPRTEPLQRDTAVGGPAIAAFDAGVQTAGQRAMQNPALHLGDRKVVVGVLVFPHVKPPPCKKGQRSCPERDVSGRTVAPGCKHPMSPM